MFALHVILSVDNDAPTQRGICYNNIAAAYRELLDYTHALYYFKKCLEIYIISYGEYHENTIKIFSKINNLTLSIFENNQFFEIPDALEIPIILGSRNKSSHTFDVVLPDEFVLIEQINSEVKEVMGPSLHAAYERWTMSRVCK
jgi:tetratricopeptide (TPR) repeat protein